MRLFLKPAVLTAAVTTTLMLGACGQNPPEVRDVKTTTTDAAAVGGPFSLIDHMGKPVTERNYLGKPQLIYFGFGFCPDVCPTSLQRMGAATDMLGRRAQDIQPIFITIDPERDTLESLALYMTANGFPENIVGLTGSSEQIDAAAKEFRVYKKRVDDPESAAGYTMDHTDIIYLMDKNGLFVDFFSGDNTPAEIAERVTTHLKTGK